MSERPSKKQAGKQLVQPKLKPARSSPSSGDSEQIPAQPEKPRVQSAARAVGILLAVARSRDGLQVKEISAALKMPRQVTYHLLHTLSATGVVRKRDQNRYVLGLATAAIAEGFRRQLGPPEQIVQKVRDVAATTGETAYASGWIDGEIVVLATARGHSAVHAAEVPQGFSNHAHARASGKLLLALADPAARDAYLDGHRFAALTRNTITSRKRFMVALEEIRNQGFALDNEEFTEGLCCLAVPLSFTGGQVVLGISVPSERFPSNFKRNLAMMKSEAEL